MHPWNRFFHFATGGRFYIDGPFGYNGEGSVLENSADTLAVRLDLDRWGPAPALHGEIHIQYLQEGSGNILTLRLDGAVQEQDPNATIHSDTRRRERRISSTLLTCSTRFDEPNELDFDLHHNGQYYPFEFFRLMTM